METKLLNNRYFVLHTMDSDRDCKTFLAIDLNSGIHRRCAIEMTLLPLVAEERRESSIRLKQHIQQKLPNLEAIAQLSLEQRQIPVIYAHFCTSDAYYLVREIVTGTNLEQKVRHEGTLPPAQVKQISIELLRTLIQLHRYNLSYQTIEPKQIILQDEDNLPVLVGVNNIVQQSTTSDRQQQETNASTYAAPDDLTNDCYQARELYSLGLTAIYLLTGKSPSALATSSTGKICLPEEIKTLDRDLAAIIQRALDLSSNYSASEMLLALQALPLKSEPTAKPPLKFQQTSSASNAKNTLNLGNKPLKSAAAIATSIATLSLSTVGVATILFGLVVWQQERALYESYDASRLKEDAPSEERSRLPKPNVALKSVTSTREPSSVEVSQTQPSSSVLPEKDIPIFVTGIQQSQLIEALGEPQAIERGFWANSNALIYKNVVDDSVDVSYLVDRSSGTLRQTEIALAQTLGLNVMEQTLSDLLQQRINRAIAEGLRQVYQRQINTYTFKVDRLEGIIKRIQEDNEDNVYIGIWEEDFH